MTSLTLTELGTYRTLPAKLNRAGEFLSQVARTPTSRSRIKLRQLTTHAVFVQDLVPLTDDEVDEAKTQFVNAFHRFESPIQMPDFVRIADNASAIRNILNVEYQWGIAAPRPVDRHRMMGAENRFSTLDQCDSILYTFEMCKPSKFDDQNLVEDTLTALTYRRLDRHLFQYVKRVRAMVQVGRRTWA